MFWLSLRIAANVVVVAGLVLLSLVVYRAATGSLATQFFGHSPGSWTRTVFALGLSLPVPFHVISVGLILQKRWLPPRFAKAAWAAVVLSGCWLGAALAVKLLAL